jgi:hypothetical protein
MCDCIAAQFSDDRKTDLGGGLRGKFGRCHLTLIGHRYSGLTQ